MMSNSQNQNTNLTEYERKCRASNSVPDPEMVAFAKKIEEDEKNLLKQMAIHIQNHPATADYEHFARSLCAAPYSVIIKAGTELAEEDATKKKQK